MNQQESAGLAAPKRRGRPARRGPTRPLNCQVDWSLFEDFADEVAAEQETLTAVIERLISRYVGEQKATRASAA